MYFLLIQYETSYHKTWKMQEILCCGLIESTEIFVQFKMQTEITNAFNFRLEIRSRKSTYTSNVRLSLLTMTNLNQMRKVLLFVRSKKADETNLSSKLPIADRTREV